MPTQKNFETAKICQSWARRAAPAKSLSPPLTRRPITANPPCVSAPRNTGAVFAAASWQKAVTASQQRLSFSMPAAVGLQSNSTAAAWQWTPWTAGPRDGLVNERHWRQRAAYSVQSASGPRPSFCVVGVSHAPFGELFSGWFLAPWEHAVSRTEFDRTRRGRLTCGRRRGGPWSGDKWPSSGNHPFPFRRRWRSCSAVGFCR